MGRLPNYGASCTGWALSLDANGSPVGYLSTTAPDLTERRCAIHPEQKLAE